VGGRFWPREIAAQFADDALVQLYLLLHCIARKARPPAVFWSASGSVSRRARAMAANAQENAEVNASEKPREVTCARGGT
jgi:hypothetical protein